MANNDVTAQAGGVQQDAENPRMNRGSAPWTAGKTDENLVDFDGPNDPANPLNWTPRHKWTITVLASMMSLVNTLAIIMCAPATPQILAEFGSSNDLDATILVSIWELGQVVGPLLIAPLSELYGRLPVYHTANIIFIGFSIGIATSNSIGTLIALRFINGLAVASLTLNSAIVGDLFVKEQRGRGIAVMGLAPKLGPLAGPVIGAYLAEAKGWRWTAWVAAMITAAFEVGFLVFYRETYKVRILQRKTERLRRETGDQSLRSKYDTGISAAQLFKQTIVRPMKLLFFSPVILLMTTYVAVAYGYTYLIFTTITEVFEGNYGFSQGPVGLTFLGLGTGLTIGVFFCGATLDWYVKKRAVLGESKPEHRLPPMALGGSVIPIGLFMYGWTAQEHVHWIVPIIATAVLGFGLVATSLPAASYLVDAFGIYAASAIAVLTILKSCVGAVLPLAGPPLYASLGLGWGNSVLGFIALAFVPVPLLLMRFGERLRKRSTLRIEG